MDTKKESHASSWSSTRSSIGLAITTGEALQKPTYQERCRSNWKTRSWRTLPISTSFGCRARANDQVTSKTLARTSSITAWEKFRASSDDSSHSKRAMATCSRSLQSNLAQLSVSGDEPNQLTSLPLNFTFFSWRSCEHRMQSVDKGHQARGLRPKRPKGISSLWDFDWRAQEIIPLRRLKCLWTRWVGNCTLVSVTMVAVYSKIILWCFVFELFPSFVDLNFLLIR